MAMAWAHQIPLKYTRDVTAEYPTYLTLLYISNLHGKRRRAATNDAYHRQEGETPG